MNTKALTTPRPRRRLVARPAFALLIWSLVMATPAAAEALTYQWRLQGFAGRIAGVVVPNHGRGELRTDRRGDGSRTTELQITSPDSARGEFFLYGSESRADGTAAEAWSSYRWRGEERNKRERVETADVVDIASGIQMIRDRRPQQSVSMRIWSDGKVYPVVVSRVGTERIAVPAGSFQAEHYRVRGVRRGNDRYWKGGLDLWLARDAVATPVRIQVERGLANVRLDLLPAATAQRR
jgi:hypothetical protein